MNTTHPRALVQDAELVDLVRAFVSGLSHPFAAVQVEDCFVFCCPRCRRLNHNGGTAYIVDGWQWSCSWCRQKGTRFTFERMVLEDADMLVRLREITEAVPHGH